MKLEKYKNDGWGLSKKQLTELLQIIENHNKKTLRLIEFGSGKSTEFLVDIVKFGIKDLEITSFDNDPNFAYKPNKGDKFINLLIRGLEECDDDSYNKMFDKLAFDKGLMKPKKTALTTRQKNNFYSIDDGDITGIFDLMILDGPNGNGRNISYLHMKDHLEINSIVLIDDYTHYDFIEKFSLFFEFDVLFESNTGNVNQWDNGGIYKILKITDKK